MALFALFFNISKPTEPNWLYQPTTSLADSLVRSEECDFLVVSLTVTVRLSCLRWDRIWLVFSSIIDRHNELNVTSFYALPCKSSDCSRNRYDKVEDKSTNNNKLRQSIQQKHLRIIWKSKFRLNMIVIAHLTVKIKMCIKSRIIDLFPRFFEINNVFSLRPWFWLVKYINWTLAIYRAIWFSCWLPGISRVRCIRLRYPFSFKITDIIRYTEM